MPSTLKTRLRSTSNSLNALRLVLALTVVVAHSWQLGGYGQEPFVAGQNLGMWAVFGFFGVSGYLITGSRISNNFGNFLQRRLRRIFPAFVVCLLLTAFVFAPIWFWHTHHSLHGFASTNVTPINYVLSNATLKINNYNVAGGPAGIPYPGAWDGSLWTLYYEFACYLLIGLVGCLAIFRRRPIAVVSTLFLVVTVAQLEASRVMQYAQNGDLGFALQLAPFFMAGAVLYVLRDRVPVKGWLAICSFGALVAIGVIGRSRIVVLAALPLAYVILWLGARLPLTRLGRRNDLSYGLYIYAFPVQQMLAIYGLHKHGQVFDVAATIACTFPLAAASWYLVERPFIGRRSAPGARVPEKVAQADQTVEVTSASGRTVDLPLPSRFQGSGSG